MFTRNLFLTTLALMIVTSPAFAEEGGSEGGGGENSVVCFNDPAIPAAIRDRSSPHYGLILDSEIASITNVESYDLYEAKMPRGLNRAVPQIIGESESAREYVEKIAKRYEPYVPYVAFLVRRGAGVFTDERIIARPAGLNRIHDENDVGYIDAGHCVVATMAAQYMTGYEPRLQLDDRLFGNARHSKMSQGVLFLHESIYYTARGAYEQKDSRATRTLVSKLINAAPTDSNAILELMQSLGLSGRYSGEFQAQNYLAIMMNKFIDDSQPALDRVLKAKHSQNNTALAQRYNRWVDTYFPGMAKPRTIYERFQFGDVPGKANRLKDGTYESISAIMDNGRTDICKSSPLNGCKAALAALLKDVHGEKGTLRQRAVAFMMERASAKLFPELAKLPQFDETIKAKARELMEQVIQKGNVSAKEEFFGGDESGDHGKVEYSFSSEESSLTELSGMSLPIP